MCQGITRRRQHGIRRLGAEVRVFGSCFDEAAAHAQALAAQHGWRLLSPFDDVDVIAGQGTMALEILEQAPELDTIVVPVGGGGLAAGCALALEVAGGGCRLLLAEPAGAADAGWSHYGGDQAGRQRRALACNTR